MHNVFSVNSAIYKQFSYINNFQCTRRPQLVDNPNKFGEVKGTSSCYSYDYATKKTSNYLSVMCRGITRIIFFWPELYKICKRVSALECFKTFYSYGPKELIHNNNIMNCKMTNELKCIFSHYLGCGLGDKLYAQSVLLIISKTWFMKIFIWNHYIKLYRPWTNAFRHVGKVITRTKYRTTIYQLIFHKKEDARMGKELLNT